MLHVNHPWVSDDGLNCFRVNNERTKLSADVRKFSFVTEDTSELDLQTFN